MRRSAHVVLALGCVVGVLGVYACGLGVTGGGTGGAAPDAAGGSDTGANTGPAGDASSSPPDAAAPTGPQGDEDGGQIPVLPTSDGGDADGGGKCITGSIAEPFKSFDTKKTWFVTTTNDQSDPQWLPYNGAKGGYMRLIPGMNSAVGGIWLQNPMPTASFDVTFHFQIDCYSAGFPPTYECADGMSLVWFPSNTPADTLGSGGTGSTLGIPPGVSGGAIALDLFQDGNTGDPPAPYVGALAIDGTQVPGNYAWGAAHSGQLGYADSHLHELEAKLVGGMLTVTLDGNTVVTQSPPPATWNIPQATFGIVAATGGDNAYFFVTDFYGAFSSCP
jgi:hypothetical protein